MNKGLLFVLRISLAALLVSGRGVAAPAAEEQVLNNGEDLTKPVNRFDLRIRYESLPDSVQSGRLFENRRAETMTLRSDLVFFPKPNQLAIRFDLPLVWNNKTTSENTGGFTEFGLGDILAQALYIHTFEERWAGGLGVQAIVPSATGRAFGNGKWQLAPTIGVRASLPEISAGSYAGFTFREFVSVAGHSTRSDINNLSLEPAFNLSLPEQWFLNCNPKIRYNLLSSKWFVPLDLMVGKKFGVHWVASLEYQYGLVRDDPRYNHWVEARVGYFF